MAHDLNTGGSQSIEGDLTVKGLSPSSPVMTDADRKLTSGSFGTGADEFAAGNHTHQGAEGSQIIAKPADQSTQSSAMVDDTDFQFAVSTNSIYKVSGKLMVSQSQLVQMLYRFDAPADLGTTMRGWSRCSKQDYVNEHQLVIDRDQLGASGILQYMPENGVTMWIVEIEAILRNVVAGTLKLQYKCSMASVANLTIKNYSYMEVTKIGSIES